MNDYTNEEDFYVNPVDVLKSLPKDLSEVYVVAKTEEHEFIVAGSYGALHTISAFARAINYVIEDKENGD